MKATRASRGSQANRGWVVGEVKGNSSRLSALRARRWATDAGRQGEGRRGGGGACRAAGEAQARPCCRGARPARSARARGDEGPVQMTICKPRRGKVGPSWGLHRSECERRSDNRPIIRNDHSNHMPEGRGILRSPKGLFDDGVGEQRALRASRGRGTPPS